MICCGREVQVIRMRAGELPVDLERCALCGTRRWVHEGRPVEANEAFDLLGTAFRLAPRTPRGAPDRSAAAAAARAAARAAAYAQRAVVLPEANDDAAPRLLPADQPMDRRRGDRVAGRTAPAAVATVPSPRQVDLAELTSALAGWQVLGTQQSVHA